MRQVLQELGTGETLVAEVPSPAAPAGGLLIRSTRSLISAGTERMVVEFGRSGWIDRARQQPEKVKQVIEKVFTDGPLATFDAVRSKLDQRMPLGYCNVGVVAEVGSRVQGFRAGDRVVSNGPHAEMVAVPRNLCARIPDSVSDDDAAFTVLGAIGLQGIRLAAPTLGESFVVTGLGLIGLITVQLLHANGCRVLGIDPDPAKCELARRFGAETVDLGAGEDPLLAAEKFSHGRGVDGVLITAATSSNEPVSQAAKMCRKRGRIVLVGVAGLQLNRSDFYEKELTFQVSCSYGPGRYDASYEAGGRDYPFGFVRWTEQRNFEAVLDLMAARKLQLEPLITHRFELSEGRKAYDLLTSGNEPYLGILLQYPQPYPEIAARSLVLKSSASGGSQAAEAPAIGVIGAGNYASRILVPALAAGRGRLVAVASSGGVSAAHLASKFGFERVTTDAREIIASPDIDTVVIATRHDTHARFVCDALEAGKHVFVEKPLAITDEEVASVEAAWTSAQTRRPTVLMVGFNRRFAPQAIRMKALLDGVRTPKTVIATINAGAIPADHWTQAPDVGGGRLIGEGCHFIDFMRFLVGAPIESWYATPIGGGGERGVCDDKTTVTLRFADGSTGTLHYFANGHPSFPKERIEVFCVGRILQLDNFRRLRGYGWQGFKKLNLWRQDKGQQACALAFIDSIRRGEPAPIAFGELIEVARATVAIGNQARA